MDLLLQKLQQFCEERSIECYLVGGSLRDLLRGQTPQDLDLAVRGDPEPVARALADDLKGRYAALSQEKGVKRLTLPKKPYGRLIIDLAPLHGESIVDDLAQRDFTINALALPVGAASVLAALRAQPEQPPAPLIDPFNGWRDLRDGVLRIVEARVFQKDPLRLLRAIRLSASRQFAIEPTTASIMNRDAPLLAQTAPERIRDELFQMLMLPQVNAAIPALDAYHLLPAIFPGVAVSDSAASLPNLLVPGGRAWPTLNAMAALLSASQGVAAALTEAEQALLAPLLRLSHRPAFKKRWKQSPARTGAPSALLLLAALLSDLLPEEKRSNAQPAERLKSIEAALKRLTIGHQPIAFVVFLLQQSAVPWQVEPRPPASSREPWRAARFYFERFGERGIDLAAFCLSRQIAVHETTPDDAWHSQARTLLHLIEGYYGERNALIPSTLLDGQVLITRLGLTKGPLIGTLLAKVRSAQLDGLIRTRAEALQFLSEYADAFSKEDRGNVLQAEHSSQKQNVLQKPSGE